MISWVNFYEDVLCWPLLLLEEHCWALSAGSWQHALFLFLACWFHSFLMHITAVTSAAPEIQTLCFMPPHGMNSCSVLSQAENSPGKASSLALLGININLNQPTAIGSRTAVCKAGIIGLFPCVSKMTQNPHGLEKHCIWDAFPLLTQGYPLSSQPFDYLASSILSFLFPRYLYSACYSF